MQSHLNSILIIMFHTAMQLSNETDVFQRRQKSQSGKKNINQTKPPKEKLLTALFQLIKMNDEQQAIRGALN